MKLGELIVDITGNNEPLVRAVETSKRKLGQFATQARQATTTIAKIGGAATLAGGAILAHLVSSSAAAAKEIRNLSTIAGATPRQFQNMAFAAQKVGIEQQDLAGILKDVQDRVGEFITTGGGPMVDFFEKIAPKVGVTAEQFKNLSGPQSLQLFVSSLEKANVSQAQMTFFMEAMAGESTRLLPLLRDNGAELQRMAGNAEDMGIALSEIEVQSLADIDRSMEIATASFTAFTQHLSAELAPTLQAIIKLITQTTDEMGGVDDVAQEAGSGLTDSFGFAADAVAGLKRVFEVLGASIALIVLQGQKQVLAFGNAVINGPINAINGLIEASNKFLGTDFEAVSISGLGEDIKQSLDTVTQAIEFGKQDIRDILMAPLPSDVLKPMVEDAKKQMQAAAETAVAARKQASGTTEASGKPQEKPVVDTAALDTLQAQLDAEFAIQLAAKQRLDELDQFYRENGLEKDKRFSELQAAIMEDKEKQLTDLAKQGQDARDQVSDAGWQAQIGMLTGSMSDLTSKFADQSKGLFKVSKAFSLAKAAVSLPSAIVESFERAGGYPFGIPAALGMAAAGLQQINAIKSANFSGAGGSAGGGVTAGGSMSAKPQQQTQPAEPQRVANITVQGSNFNRESVMQFGKQMKQLQKDGFEFNI